MQKIDQAFLKSMWKLTRLYWFSNEKWIARILLTTIIGLNLGHVYMLVLFNSWYNRFYNTLQDYDQSAFFSALGYFSILATIYIIIAVYEFYLQQMLQIKWRRWLTANYLEKWLKQQTYYMLELTNNSTDNPDQRISEDLQLFVSLTLQLSLGMLRASVTLVSFVAILWNLSGNCSISLGGMQLDIPGYMVWFAILYAIIGTWLTVYIGRPLVKLNFLQQRFEADFRFSLVRIRENCEGIAFYRGEEREQVNLAERFKKLFDNFWQLMKRQKQLTWFTSGYSQIAIIFPYVVAAPRYFSREIQLGGLMQTASAFGRIQDALSFFVDNYPLLAQWQAVINRLLGYGQSMEQVGQTVAQALIQVDQHDSLDFTVTNLQVALPDGRQLLAELDLTLKKGDKLLITGPSGCGKSTLMRTMAGIWPFGQGAVHIPQGDVLLFLPQKAYLPLGSLRDVLIYPQLGLHLADEQIIQVMKLCNLGEFAAKLHTVDSWSHVLSLGEQQRVAFARVLLLRPQWIFLDEATSALDELVEQAMYQLLATQLGGSTIISVGHRSTLLGFHQQKLTIDNRGNWELATIAGR